MHSWPSQLSQAICVALCSWVIVGVCVCPLYEHHFAPVLFYMGYIQFQHTSFLHKIVKTAAVISVFAAKKIRPNAFICEPGSARIPPVVTQTPSRLGREIPDPFTPPIIILHRSSSPSASQFPASLAPRLSAPPHAAPVLIIKSVPTYRLTCPITNWGWSLLTNTHFVRHTWSDDQVSICHISVGIRVQRHPFPALGRKRKLL